MKRWSIKKVKSFTQKIAKQNKSKTRMSHQGCHKHQSSPSGRCHHHLEEAEPRFGSGGCRRMSPGHRGHHSESREHHHHGPHFMHRRGHHHGMYGGHRGSHGYHGRGMGRPHHNPYHHHGHCKHQNDHQEAATKPHCHRGHHHYGFKRHEHSHGPHPHPHHNQGEEGPRRCRFAPQRRHSIDVAEIECQTEEPNHQEC